MPAESWPYPRWSRAKSAKGKRVGGPDVRLSPRLLQQHWETPGVHYRWTPNLEPDEAWHFNRVDYFRMDPRTPNEWDEWPFPEGTYPDEIEHWVDRLYWGEVGDQRIWGQPWSLGVERSAHWHALLDAFGPMVGLTFIPSRIDSIRLRGSGGRKTIPFSVSERMQFAGLRIP